MGTRPQTNTHPSGIRVYTLKTLQELAAEDIVQDGLNVQPIIDGEIHLAEKTTRIIWGVKKAIDRAKNDIGSSSNDQRSDELMICSLRDTLDDMYTAIEDANVVNRAFLQGVFAKVAIALYRLQQSERHQMILKESMNAIASLEIENLLHQLVPSSIQNTLARLLGIGASLLSVKKRMNDSI